MGEFRFYDHALAFAVGVLLPLLAALSQRSGARAEPLQSRERIAAWWSNAIMLCLVAGAVIAAWLASGRGLAALGLRAPRPQSVGIVALLVGGMIAGYVADTWWGLGNAERRARSVARWREQLAIHPRSAAERPHFALLSACAGFCEEVAFRGHLVLWLRSLVGESSVGFALAIALPALPFALAHLYQGVADAAKIFAFALAFGALLLVTESLWIGIVLDRKSVV